MRIIFMGTPDFAVPSLERLVRDGHEVVLAVTQPDKPKGRGNQLTPPPVKARALALNIPVFQPVSMKTEETYETLAACRPDLIVVVAYGKILPQRVLDLPPHGCINVHASLLPRYRGAAPIQWAVLNGDAEAGVTTMKMEAGLDTGDMLLKCRRPLPADMTRGRAPRFAGRGWRTAAVRDARCAASGNAPASEAGRQPVLLRPHAEQEPQPAGLDKAGGCAAQPGAGLNPWPCATCRLGSRTLKVHRTRVGEACREEPGTIVKTSPFTIACGGGSSLELLEVQAEGSKRMAAADFLRGHPVKAGVLLEAQD